MGQFPKLGGLESQDLIEECGKSAIMRAQARRALRHTKKVATPVIVLDLEGFDMDTLEFEE